MAKTPKRGKPHYQPNLTARQTASRKRPKMALYPYGSAIESGEDLKDLFVKYDRDYYPDGYYNALFDYLTDINDDDAAYEVDVIGLCCDISETPLSEIDDVDDYSVLYQDDENGVLYHWAW